MLAPGYLHRKRCVLPSRQVLATLRFIGGALIFAIANAPLIRSKSTFSVKRQQSQECQSTNLRSESQLNQYGI